MARYACANCHEDVTDFALRDLEYSRELRMPERSYSNGVWLCGDCIESLFHIPRISPEGELSVGYLRMTPELAKMLDLALKN